MNAEGVEIATNVLDISAANLGDKVVFAFSAALLLFFVIAPITGFIFSRVANRWQNTLLVMSSSSLVAVISNVAINWILRRVLPQGRLGDIEIGLIAALGAFSLAWFMGRMMSFMLAPLGKSYYEVQEDALSEDDLMPFERRRRRHMARRKHDLRRD